MAGRWAETTPQQARDWLAHAAVDWWFAGGWALELWLGRPIRLHSDLEISCFRQDIDALLAAFAGWDIVIARDKVLTPYRGPATAMTPPFSLWLRPPGAELWALEIIPEEGNARDWFYRRDARITRRCADLTETASSGDRVVAPDIQLLYKSKARRPKDELDFDAILPAMRAEQVSWLATALALIDRNHPWLARLSH